MKTHLYQDHPLHSTTSDSRYKQAIRGELVWFMTHFNKLYESMNNLGMVRDTLAQCATALRQTPVELRQSYTVASSSSPELDHSSAAGSISTPIDEPMFYLLKDSDFEPRMYQDASSTFKEQYDNHSMFKLAVEAHSSPSKS